MAAVCGGFISVINKFGQAYMMNKTNSWRIEATNKAANSWRQQDFGSAESVNGIAGESSIGMSEIFLGTNHSTTSGDGSVTNLGTNHSTTTGDGSVNPKMIIPRSDASYYENDSVMLWSDDPEAEYFAYMLQKEQENRARQGKAAEDSLIGDSTREEIQQEFSRWHQQGGGQLPEPDRDPSSDFPVLSTSHRSLSSQPPQRQNTLDGFSLATEEKSRPKQEPTQLDPPPLPPTCKRTLFPDVIYVTDTPATSVSMSKPSQDSSSTNPRRIKWFLIALLFMGFLCLVAAAVAILLSAVSKDGSSPNTNNASAIKGITGEKATILFDCPEGMVCTKFTDGCNSCTSLTGCTEMWCRCYEDDSCAPKCLDNDWCVLATDRSQSSSLKPTLPPSLRPAGNSQVTTSTPTNTMQPSAEMTTEETSSSSPMADPSTGSPTIPPVTRKPTEPPTNDPSDPNAVPANVFCGCKYCEYAIDRMAEGYSCGDRMNYLMYERGYTEMKACHIVAEIEFPSICGPLCDPTRCEVATGATKPANYRPTQNPSAQVELVLRGDDGLPVNVYPLGICEGDCDDDEDCATGLACFQRDEGVPVPGCLHGSGESSDKDFCVLEQLLVASRAQSNTP